MSKNKKGAEGVSTKEETESSELLNVLKGVSDSLDSLDKRLISIETGGRDDFKSELKSEDVELAEKNKEDTPPKIREIVNQILGEDFVVEVQGFNDRPGYMFHLILPDRLSAMPITTRPIPHEKKEKEYKKDRKGNVVFETYRPEDRRSRMISDINSLLPVKEHCEKVRSFIVSTYQKKKQPMPELKLTQ